MRPNIRAPSVTPMAKARTDTNGLKIDVAALRMSVMDGALNWGVEHLLLLTTYQSWPTGLEQGRRNRTARARRPTAPATTAPCVSRKQRNEPRGNVRHDCERRRVEHVGDIYHSRPADVINRSATTVTTTTTSVAKSDSATRPPIHNVEHRQYRDVHHQLHHSALILHSADISTSAQNRQAGCALHSR